jgi:HK97 gp10 family phage protein
MQVKIEGVPELERKLDKMTKSVSGEKMSPICLKAAQMVRDAIKQKAPQGPTGNLRRSPVAKLMTPREFFALAIAAIDRKIAPHAHLLEFGTVKMRPHPFFRPAWDENREKANKMVQDGIKQLIEGSI